MDVRSFLLLLLEMYSNEMEREQMRRSQTLENYFTSFVFAQCDLIIPAKVAEARWNMT